MLKTAVNPKIVVHFITPTSPPGRFTGILPCIPPVGTRIDSRDDSWLVGDVGIETMFVESGDFTDTSIREMLDNPNILQEVTISLTGPIQGIV